jgi:hypothetical protein
MSRRKRVRSRGGQTEPAIRCPVTRPAKNGRRTPDYGSERTTYDERTTTNERNDDDERTANERRRRTNDDERAKDERSRSRSNASVKTKPGATVSAEDAPVVLDLPAALSSDVDRPTGPGGRFLQKQYARGRAGVSWVK